MKKKIKLSGVLKSIIIGMIFFTACTSCPKKAEENQVKNKSSYMDTKNFRVFVNANDVSGTQWKGYNGIKALIPNLTGNNIFVPYFAGLNFETINMTGLEPYPGVFEPRLEPMSLNKISDKKIELIMPETSHAHISAKITFTVEEPYYIHQSIEITFHKLFAKEGEKNTFNALFASYVNVPVMGNLFLRQTFTKGNPLEDWISITKESHASKDFLANHLPSDRKLNIDDYLSIVKKNIGKAEPDNNFLSSNEIGEPNAIKIMGDSLSYYFGHLYNGLIYLQMFKQPAMFRLAYSPTGGGFGDRGDYSGKIGNPAWDYVLYLDDIKIDTIYKWECCLAIKQYDGREDIVNEVINYRNK